MVVEKFSHAQHLVSGIGCPSGRKDSFRCLSLNFPFPTAGGAPKVRAVELIAALESEKRGVYAGAVGYFGYNSVSLDGPKIHDGTVGTYIALLP